MIIIYQHSFDQNSFAIRIVPIREEKDLSILTSGTSYKLTLENISYDTLLEHIGVESSGGDEYKTDAEWEILTPFGMVCLYNWKNGKNYQGEEGLALADITEWNIGAHTEKAAQCLVSFLRQREEGLRAYNQFAEQVNV